MPDEITGPRHATWHLIHGAHGWLGYAVAILCAGLIVLARIALYPVLPHGYPFITLFIGVLLSAWYGGFGPGLATLLWGVIGVWYFIILPARAFGPLSSESAVALTVNVLNNLVLICIATVQHASRRRAERSARREAVRASALEAEMERRQTAESALRSVLESTTDAYVGFDGQWRLDYANAQAGAILGSLGLTLESLRGRQPWQLWAEPDGGELESRLRRVVSDRADATLEYLHSPTGRRLELHAFPTQAGLAVFFRDVTDERRAQQQLTEAQRMDAVGKLAGGVAHEVNNQMTVVLGAASFLLRRPDLPVWAREELGHVREAASRSAAVTSQLLAFGRRQMLRPELVDLNHVVREMETILSRAVGPAVEIETVLSQDPAAVLADKGQLIQALLNLAFNARDAMPEGGRLRIETAATRLRPRNHADNGADAPPGDYISLSVTDSGIGMEPATLRRAFEPFFTTKPVGQGTGLGLSTVYGIVRQSGGYIAAESTAGAGARFTIHLPRATADTPAAGGPAPRPSGAHGTGAAVRRGTALVVEDEPSVRDMVSRVLADQGYDVLQASNGVEALDLVERMSTDGALRLVVTDLAMPVMGGRELARRLAERRPDPVPLLFISGYTDDDLVRQNLLEHGQQFLPKPFSPDALAARVKRLVEG
jgi:PAS domain S-box-containing protein